MCGTRFRSDVVVLSIWVGIGCCGSVRDESIRDALMKFLALCDLVVEWRVSTCEGDSPLVQLLSRFSILYWSLRSCFFHVLRRAVPYLLRSCTRIWEPSGYVEVALRCDVCSSLNLILVEKQSVCSIRSCRVVLFGIIWAKKHCT